jgi:hypothetical protein
MCLDIKNFYLTAALEYFEYMKMPLNLFPIWIIEQYDLTNHAKDGWIHLKMQCTIWGLPQAGILANKRLCRKLAPFGYYKCINTPGLWYHETCPITFMLVVDDFGVKYVDKANVEHLIASIKMLYMLAKDWTGDLYCGIKLGWDYKKHTVDNLMPGYIQKKLQEYEHIHPKNNSIVCTHPSPNSLAAKPNGLSQATIPNFSTNMGKKDPEIFWEHFVLCLCIGHDGTDDVEYRCNVANASHQKYKDTLHLVVRLPCNACRCLN